MEYCRSRFVNHSPIFVAVLLTLPIASADYPNPVQDESLRQFEYLLDELDQRRRLQFLFPNPQSPFVGLNIGFVATSTGHLTFQRRDIVVLNADNLVVSRIYDSRSDINEGFGKGWALNLQRRIELVGSTAIYRDGNGFRSILSRTSIGNYAPVVALPITDGMELSFNKDGAILNEPDGGITKFEMASEFNHFRVSEYISPRNLTSRFHYEEEHLKRVTVEDQLAIELTWSGNHIQRINDLYARSTIYEYYNQGNLSRVRDIAREWWSYSYDPNNRLISAFDLEKSKYLKAQFDDLGRVAQISTDCARSFQYSENLTEVVTNTGLKHSFTFDQNGITVSYRNDRGIDWRVELDHKNRPIKLWRQDLDFQFEYLPDGIEVRYSYGWFRVQQSPTRSLIQSDAVNPEWRPLVDVSAQPDGLVTIEDEQNGNYYTSDLTGRLYQARYEELDYDFKYDEEGLLSVVTQDEQSMTFERNQFGRIAETQYPSGKTAKYTYNTRGNRTKATYQEQSTVSFRHDHKGNITQAPRPTCFWSYTPTNI